MWPLLLLLVLALVEKRTRPLALMFVLAFGAMLLVSEFIYVQDPSGGKFTRTNTTMKWWGWMWSGALLSLGAMAVASHRAWGTPHRLCCAATHLCLRLRHRVLLVGHAQGRHGATGRQQLVHV